MKTHKETENAFMQIRQCAGNDDVQQIVNKFLSKEQTYLSLLQSVKDGEKKFEDLKRTSEEKQSRLHALQLEYDNKKRFDEKDERQEDRDLAHTLKTFQDDNAMEDEYRRLSKELDQLKAHNDHLKQRKNNIQLIND